MAIAHTFAAEGAKVVIASRTAGELVRAAKALAAGGAHVLPVACDVSREKDVARLVAATLKRFGRIDILVNNAGVLGPVGPVSTVDQDAWGRAVYINVVGTFLCTRAVLPSMLKRKQGTIINLSGGGAAAPRPNVSAYSASKAAVVRFTETLAEELKGSNIQVNAIAPGAVHTRMTEELARRGRLAGDKELDEAVRTIETGGVSPYKAAELALFLASGRAGRLTGKLISAPWDDWKHFGKRAGPLSCSALYTLRRIDGRHFKEVRRC